MARLLHTLAFRINHLKLPPVVSTERNQFRRFATGHSGWDGFRYRYNSTRRHDGRSHGNLQPGAVKSMSISTVTKSSLAIGAG